MEHSAQSGLEWALRSRFLTRWGVSAAAPAAFRKRLELQPDNPEAKQLVDMVTRRPPH